MNARLTIPIGVAGPRIEDDDDEPEDEDIIREEDEDEEDIIEDIIELEGELDTTARVVDFIVELLPTAGRVTAPPPPMRELELELEELDTEDGVTMAPPPPGMGRDTEAEADDEAEEVATPAPEAMLIMGAATREVLESSGQDETVTVTVFADGHGVAEGLTAAPPPMADDEDDDEDDMCEDEDDDESPPPPIIGALVEVATAPPPRELLLLLLLLLALTTGTTLLDECDMDMLLERDDGVIMLELMWELMAELMPMFMLGEAPALARPNWGMAAASLTKAKLAAMAARMFLGACIVSDRRETSKRADWFAELAGATCANEQSSRDEMDGDKVDRTGSGD